MVGEGLLSTALYDEEEIWYVVTKGRWQKGRPSFIQGIPLPSFFKEKP